MNRFFAHLFLPVAVASALLLGGCAQVPRTSTGFLSDYSNLQTASAAGENRRAYTRPDFVPSDYPRVVIEPTVLRLNAKDALKLEGDEAATLQKYCEAELRRVLGRGRSVVAEAGPGTLRVRSAVTGVETSNPALNVVTGVLFWPIDYGGVSVEFEVLDAQSGVQVAALSAASTGTPLQVLKSFSRLGHARGGIEHWVEKLGQLLTAPASAATSRSAQSERRGN